MELLRTVRVTRRRLIAGTSTLIAAIVAACSSESPDDEPTPAATTDPEPTNTPRPSPTAASAPNTPTPTIEPSPTPQPPISVRLWSAFGQTKESPQLVQRVTQALTERLNASDFSVEIVDAESEATVRLVGASESGEAIQSVTGEPLIPVVSLRQTVDSVTTDQLIRLIGGQVGAWNELGGPDWSVQPLVYAPSQAIAGDIGSSPNPVDDFASFLRDNPGAIILIPRSAATFHVQAMMVDDVDPLRDGLGPSDWPFWERVAIQIGDDHGSEIQPVVQAAIDDLNTSAPSINPTMMSVAGDVILGRTVHRIMVESNDFLAPFRLVADELQRGDLTVGNLECSITGSFDPPTDPRTFSFMTFPQAIDGLTHAGFNALSQANNHSMDYGAQGMQDTVTLLSDAGIKHFGIGENLEAARQPCILEHGGIRFAWLGYDGITGHFRGATNSSAGTSPTVTEYVVEDVARAREVADVVIPYFHWGTEYVLTPSDADRRLARAALDAGADIVLGSHPHWVQGMEVHDGKPIFYSLSNFVFDQEWSLETKQGFILHLTFYDTRFVGFRVVPVLIEDYHRPRVVEDDMRETILDRFWESTDIMAANPIA